MIEFLKDYKVRRWIYGVATAILLFLGAQGIISSAEVENIGGIIESILVVSASGVTVLAARKANPKVALEDTAAVNVPVVIDDELDNELVDASNDPEIVETHLGILGNPDEAQSGKPAVTDDAISESVNDPSQPRHAES